METDTFKTRFITQVQAYQNKRVHLENLPINFSDRKRVPYGTSGFRGKADQIEHIFYNVGIICGLKCIYDKGNVGCMITASHNPVQDNGVKLVGSNGEMIDAAWEKMTEDFCNIHDLEESFKALMTLIKELKIDINGGNYTGGEVIIGMDTRPTSAQLVKNVERGLRIWSGLKIGCRVVGLVTTPLLHYLVGESNKKCDNDFTEQNYFNQLSSGIAKIFHQDLKAKSSNYSSNQLVVDCANGVGCVSMKKFLDIPDFAKTLPVQLINTGEGVLNSECGADFVKAHLKVPKGATELGKRYASLDGDADRLIYFYLAGENKELRICDGDKIMTLFGIYLKELIEKNNLQDELTIGCIQTAYANGSGTDYIRNNLGLKVEFGDTGVKYLHRLAIKYDIGIYFEANGHGTIWVSQKAREIIENAEKCSQDFRNLLQILNNYTGDAISDIFIVETILQHYDWSIEKWFSLYEDRPNSLMKIQVPDRQLMKTTNAGQTCTEPKGLQAAIDAKVAEFGCGARSFVRPSGTEDLIRVFAEAETQAKSDELASAVCKLVAQFMN